MQSGIYQIANQVNGNHYVGSAVNLAKRWQHHLRRLRHGGHKNEHLQRAFAKYGEAAFVFSVLEQIEDSSQLIPREQHYLDTLNPEYNIAPIAGSRLGCRHTKEARRKMSRTRMGRRPSKETRRKLSERQIGKRNHNYGKHPSKQTKRKMSEALSGKRNPNYGKHPSEEIRAKMSKAHMNHSVSAETKRKLSAMQIKNVERQYQQFYAHRNARIVHLYEQGMRQGTIGLRLALSQSAVSRAIKRHRERVNCDATAI